MPCRRSTGAGIAKAVAEALSGGPGVAVAADVHGFPPSWQLDGPPLDDGVAVLVGTSGSTGDPKGVQLTADAIGAAVTATHDRLGSPGHWVCPLPLHYVAGVMTVARSALAGTRLSVVPTDLTSLPRHPGRNYASVVAAQLHRALDDRAITADLARFDAVLVGGSAIPPALLQRGRSAGVNLVATYGMAETCGGCVYDGLPLAGVQVAIDLADRIAITSPAVFSGYRLDPAATAAALTGRTLRTNDRGRWSGGRLQVLGRVDDVVITGGVNVDLAAAQRVADAAFGPARLALLAVPDERWGVRIVALTDAAIELAECRARLADSLQPAAVPRDLRRVAGLPRTSTGKIDRTGLRRLWAEGS